MIKRAAIYARVSKAYKEDDERVTIESQLSDCEEYCQKKGYLITGDYIDKDKYRSKKTMVNPSGARKDRPGYVKMIKDARNDEFDLIIAWKEDRLYRGMYAALPISELLDEKRNINVELVTETFDVKMLGIKAAMAKVELDNIRDRMVRGRRARLERGEVPGGKARYGYYKDETNFLQIDDKESAIVRQIYEWYNNGINGMEIRRRLNGAGVKARVGDYWSKMTIQNILNFDGYVTGQYTTSLDDEIFTISCPPIISYEVWIKSLETREKNTSHRGRNVKEDYLCRGLVYCSCGWKWTARTCHKGNGKYGYYGCSRRDHQTENVHSDCPGTIGTKKTDDFVWDFVIKICKNPQIIQDAIDAKIEYYKSEQSAIEADAERLQREIDKVTEERQWVITQARKGRITDEDMEMQLAALHFQTLDLRKKHNDQAAALAIHSQAEQLKEWADQYLQDIKNGLSILETPVVEMNDGDRENLYIGLGASMFESKYSGDKTAALNWAILEEKRRIVRTLISGVLVVKTPDEPKKIIPQLALEVPKSFASLVYDDQSLAYVDQAREMAGKAQK